MYPTRICCTGVFAQGGMKDYLKYVRSSPKYSSRYIESTLEWRDDVPDGMEVSTWLPGKVAERDMQGTGNLAATQQQLS